MIDGGELVMPKIPSALLLLVLATISYLEAEDKPTSLTDARSAVETNLRTPEGKAYDQQLEMDFVQNHLAAVHQCRQNVGSDRQSFWFLLRLDKDGTAKEVLLYPETKLGTCSRLALLKDKFPLPPKAAYWASIYLKPSR